MSRLSYDYMCGQFDLTGGDIELDFCPSDAQLAAIHLMFLANQALAFESHERETKEEKYARWGIS